MTIKEKAIFMDLIIFIKSIVIKYGKLLDFFVRFLTNQKEQPFGLLFLCK